MPGVGIMRADNRSISSSRPAAKPTFTLTGHTTLLKGPSHLVKKSAHSAKLIEAYDWFESLVPAARYFDLFSRHQHNERWDCHGFKAPAALGERRDARSNRKDAKVSAEEQPSNGAEIDRLADIAKEANIVNAVANLDGAFVQFMQRETDAYVAQAGDAWTDEGLAAWIKAREAEMQRAWRTDVADLTGGGGK
jgi:hypothetical protein